MDPVFRDIETKNLSAVRDEAVAIHRRLFPEANDRQIGEAFEWAEAAFTGNYAGFQPIDAKYHDLEHTLQGALCFVRILDGYVRSGSKPEMTPRMFHLGLLAILLHDTGYLKEEGDAGGTGAKYTLVHVQRSAEFAGRLLQDKGFAESEVTSIRNMIRCTGVNADLRTIPFQDELERRVGYALGTADLLGQMAAADYVEKLEILYQEFEESNRFNGATSGPGVFTSAEDLRRKTPHFWGKYVLPKIENDFAGMYRLLNSPHPMGRNEYLERIKANISRLEREFGIPAAD